MSSFVAFCQLRTALKTEMDDTSVPPIGLDRFRLVRLSKRAAKFERTEAAERRVWHSHPSTSKGVNSAFWHAPLRPRAQAFRCSGVGPTEARGLPVDRWPVCQFKSALPIDTNAGAGLGQCNDCAKVWSTPTAKELAVLTGHGKGRRARGNIERDSTGETRAASRPASRPASRQGCDLGDELVLPQMSVWRPSTDEARGEIFFGDYAMLHDLNEEAVHAQDVQENENAAAAAVEKKKKKTVVRLGADWSKPDCDGKYRAGLVSSCTHPRIASHALSHTHAPMRQSTVAPIHSDALIAIRRYANRVGPPFILRRSDRLRARPPLRRHRHRTR
jgi:hypothetical protein